MKTKQGGTREQIIISQKKKRKKEIMSLAVTWMDLGMITLSEVS